jgi:uncharacterized protein
MHVLIITPVCVVLMLLVAVIDLKAQSQNPVVPGSSMHSSWDLDGDSINDCELDGTCDHTIDYSQPRKSKVVPAFDCKAAGLNSTEKLICSNPQLSIFDRKMSKVYGSARLKVQGTSFTTLKTEQRGWLKERDDCWKDENHRRCIYDSYLLRIAELQAKYRLVKFVGPTRYVCGDSKANEVAVTFFQTSPPTLIAERGDSVSLMYRQQDGDQFRYQGRNEILFIDGSMVRLTWGFQVPEIICRESLVRRVD